MGCPSDDTLVAMLEHALPPAAFADLEEHIDSCEHCRKVVAAAVTADGALAAGTPGQGADDVSLPQGAVAGRYVIDALLGRGGMGAVYLARDLTLGREVAVKVHRVGSAGDRLQREAVAMAKLAHPNVVTVFEVTSIDDRLCVAMEYVRGTTLRGWLARRRSWRDVVALLEGAGAGLAAAHDAGLVHRDFKPENVLVGDDGRPRVGDFGLARAGAQADAPPSSAALAHLTTPMTVTGTVLGTPAYMAPEQLAGEVVDARADQFAFCVVAWESLYGKRPFGGTTLAGLQEAIELQQLAAPRASEVPDRVRAVLARGLALAPDARYSDMRALLEALRHAARPRTRRRIAIAAVATIALGGAALAGATTLGAHRREAACTSEGDAIRARFGDHRDQIRAAFVATGASNAAASFDHTASVLVRASDALALQAVATCRGRAEPERMTEARRACLAARDSELAALVDVLEHAGAATVHRAPAAAWSVFDPAPCDDAHTLLAGPATAAPRTIEHTAMLGRARALHDAGRYKEGIEVAQPLADDARARGDRALELSALIVLGHLREEVDPPEQVAPIYDRALALAEAQGRDLDAAGVLNSIANLSGVMQKDHASAHRSIALARAKLERVGDGNVALKGALFATEAQVFYDDDRLGEADGALHQSVAALEQALGGDNPKLGNALGSLAQIQLAEGKTDEALATSERAYELLARALGDDHPTVAGADMTIAQALTQLKRFPEARTRLLRADAVFLRVFGPEHPLRAAILGNLSALEQQQQHWDAALVASRRALAIIEHAEGVKSADAAGAHGDIARTLALAGRLDDARAEQQRVVEIDDELGAAGAGRLPSALVALAQIELSRNQPELALPIAERAVALAAKRPADADPVGLADARFTLARILRLVHRDPARARELAGLARATASPEARPEIDSWLAVQ